MNTIMIWHGRFAEEGHKWAKRCGARELFVVLYAGGITVVSYPKTVLSEIKWCLTQWWYLPFLYPVWGLSPRDCELTFATTNKIYGLKQGYFCPEESQIMFSRLEELWLGPGKMLDQCEMEAGWDLDSPLGPIQEQRKHPVVLMKTLVFWFSWKTVFRMVCHFLISWALVN